MSNRAWLSFVIAAACLVACNEPFESPARVDSLRVLGVSVEPPTAAPGQRVELEMLYADPAGFETTPEPYRGATGDVELLWLAGCHNPPGGQYYACGPSLSSALQGLADLPEPSDVVGFGSRFATRIPEDIVRGLPSGDEGVARGTSFVFFAACKGHLEPDAAAVGALPLACVDDAGRALGPDFFVTGFVTIQSYATLQSANPLVTGGTIDGERVAALPCATDADCTTLNGALDYACSDDGQCLVTLPPCPSGCRDVELAPVIAPESAELDPTGTRPGEATPREVLWVKYYSLGAIDRHEALAHDRVAGWRDDIATAWKRPRTARRDVMRTWAVVQDNRGGTAWFEWRMLVR
jgi:hypothetical protein